MIKIRRFDEKVSKAEKEEILKDSDIRVGVEFEIESEVSVVRDEEEEDTEEYFERREEYLEDVIKDNFGHTIEVLSVDKNFFTAPGSTADYIKEELEELGYTLGEDYNKNNIYLKFSPADYTKWFLEDFDPSWADTQLNSLFYYIILDNGTAISFEVEYGYDTIEDFDDNDRDTYLVKDTKVDPLLKQANIDFENQQIEKAQDIDSKIISDLENIVGDSITVFSSYHGGQKSSGWRAEPDSSLGEKGFELITPDGGLPLQRLFPIIKGVFNYIDSNSNLYTSKSTGLHISMSIKGVNLKEEMDPLKLALFMEEGKVFKYFESRKNNRFTLSVLRQLQKPDPTIVADKKEKEYQQIIEDMSNRVIPKHKYYGINLTKIDKGMNYVEFRYIGGADYHRKFDIIRKQILDYGFFLKLSTNREYKWKEYMLKINRLLNIVEGEVKIEEIKNEIIEISEQILMNNDYLFFEASGEFVDILERINKKGYDIGEFRYHLENCMKDFILRSFTLFRENMIDDDYLWTHLEQFMSTAGDSIKEYWPTGTLLWDDLIKGQIQKMKDRGKIDYPVEPIIKRLRI